MKIELSLGAIIAGILSYKIGNGILWILLHMFFGWFYVIYYALFL